MPQRAAQDAEPQCVAAAGDDSQSGSIAAASSGQLARHSQPETIKQQLTWDHALMYSQASTRAWAWPARHAANRIKLKPAAARHLAHCCRQHLVSSKKAEDVKQYGSHITAMQQKTSILSL